ncbi:MAG TPA: ABC transporter ATP-binding protein [Acidimicrobiales bacterium]|jgi:ATP-binding cassette subfamily B protein|nr:ABC transporter ATP-binding protein [Acidimicrobiales bacterium]
MKLPTRKRAATDEQGTTFVPVTVKAQYEAPRASIDPDKSKSWLRRALPVMRAHKFVFGISMVLTFVGLVLQVLVPNLLNDAINNSIQHHTVPLSHYVWWIVGLAVGGGIAGYISRLFLFETAYNFEYDLRNIIYEHLTKMSFAFYDRVQSGQLISRANSDIRSVQMYMTFAPLILVQCSIAIVAFGFMLSIDVPLAFVAMATMPFVYFVGVRMRRSMFPVSWIIQARLAEVATVVDENVNGVRVVKSFAAEEQQLKNLSKATDRVQWGYIKDADIRARFTPAVQNLPQVGLALVLLFGGYMVIHGQLGVGAILAFNAYLLMLQAPFMMLGMLIMMGQRAAASADRIYEILDEEPTVTDKPDAVDLTDCRGDVRFSDVRFAYDGENDNLVLADFNLHLSPGETVALVGRTGAGKSTVSRLLTRFYDVNSGSVRIDDHDIRDLTMDSLRANIGIVLDEPFLFSVSVRDNIAYGKPDASFDDIEAAARAAGAHEFISELEHGYDTVVGERGYTLSGGQRQRIAIARTLLVNPPILVLDDATSAIDVQVELEIHAGLRVLMEGRTTLIIAHRLSTISLADRVVLLDQHRIVADGTHAELLETTPLYGEVLAQAVDDLEPNVEDEPASTNGTSTANGNGHGVDAGRADPVGSARSTGRDQ